MTAKDWVGGDLIRLDGEMIPVGDIFLQLAGVGAM